VLFFQAPAAGVSAFTYLLTGRFSAQRELEKYPSADAAQIERARRLAGERKDPVAAEELAAAGARERQRVLGSAAEWEGYREEFEGFVADAQQTGLIDSRKDLGQVFKSLDMQGRPVRDEDGRLWMEIEKDGGRTRVGLSGDTVVSEKSDPILSYRLMLARVHQALTGSADARPAIAAFEQDWELLEATRENAEAWQGNAARK
jgi:hypothetical protein